VGFEKQSGKGGVNTAIPKAKTSGGVEGKAVDKWRETAVKRIASQESDIVVKNARWRPKRVWTTPVFP